MSGNRILLAHGDGGKLTHELIEGVFLKHFESVGPQELADSAIMDKAEFAGSKLAMTTDSFVVNPIRFRGGDIGKLAIAGTVNDLAVAGAVPKYLTAGFIIEEGLPLEELEEIVESMSKTAASAGVRLVAGDTKVVNKGAADKIFINTTGIGYIPEGRDLGFHRISPGDAVIVSGPVGDHGMAIMSERAGIAFDTEITSDCAPLNGVIAGLLDRFEDVKFMRDPTRGGLATVLVEIALSAGCDVHIEEEKIPVRPEVRAAAEMLGLDPLYLANEGKFVCIAASSQAREIVDYLRGIELGAMAAVIGEIRNIPAGEGHISKERTRPGRLYLQTPLGGHKRLDMLTGEQLPRIC